MGRGGASIRRWICFEVRNFLFVLFSDLSCLQFLAVDVGLELVKEVGELLFDDSVVAVEFLNSKVHFLVFTL